MYKRIIREILENWARYFALAILTAIAVGMYIGFLCGTTSSKDAYVAYQEENKLEDGYFILDGELDFTIRQEIEKLDMKIHNNFYTELQNETEVMVRVFDERKDIDLPYVVEGKLPKTEKDIFLDQIFAKKQKLSVGDTIKLGEKDYSISGIGAFPDYTISLENNSQMIADRNNFGVAMVSTESFRKQKDVVYQYSIAFEKKMMTENKQKEEMKEMIKKLAILLSMQGFNQSNNSMEENNIAQNILSFTDTVNNKRIAGVVKKMESNLAMAKMFIGVMFLIIAFLYTIFTKRTIDQECSVLGTLIALGINKKDILFSYILPPCIVTLIGGMVGCLLGIRVFYKLPIHSFESYYSMPKNDMKFDVITLLVAVITPLIFIIIIHLIEISRKLAIKPLNLIKKDLESKKRSAYSRVNGFSFEFRFKWRVFTQSFGAYILLFIGIFLAGWLMMFGIGMASSFDAYVKSQETDVISEYQYSVADGYYVNNKNVESATILNFDYDSKTLKQTYNLTGIGVQKQSKFFPNLKEISSGEIIISNSVAKKFGLHIGDVIRLENSVTGTSDEYKVQDITAYNMGLAVFMNQEEMNHIFNKKEDYFNYYFSDEKLEIPSEFLKATITKEDMVKNGIILKNVMQSMIVMFPTMAIIVYFIMMFLLIHMILSQNEIGISMLKIFGYTDKEVQNIYIKANTMIIIIFLLITLPLQSMLMTSIWPACITTIPGYFDFVMEIKDYIIIFITGILCYFLVNILLLNKIKNVSEVDMLKDNGM